MNRIADTIGRREFLAALAVSLGGELRAQTPTARPDFTLNIGSVSVEPRPGKIFRTIGYNGFVPGPLIRCREGQQVTIEVNTNLPQR